MKMATTSYLAEKIRCPVCHECVGSNLRSHIVDAHGEGAFRQAVLADKERGMPDAQIGDRYSISFGTLEQIITEAYGANVSVLKRPKRIKRWQPPNFREETTTVWSFKQRGDWATHNGRYRGNWSPYIPRNVILKYSKPGDIVLDYFVGGGTTAVEAKLLGRRCIARDINPGAIGITLENLSFSPPRELFGDEALSVHEPEVSVGDARDLSDIPTNSIDLICAHPPYAGIIKYSSKIKGDLSGLSVQDFLTEIRKVAKESWRVLKPGGKCAILIGDARKSKHVVPIGFETIRVFLDAGFVLRELIIKRQHNCRATGFWYARSIQYNFLLLAHEYLPVFEKPLAKRFREPPISWKRTLTCQVSLDKISEVRERNLETTTVWIFPRDRTESEVRRNLIYRFCGTEKDLVEIQFNIGHGKHGLDLPPLASPRCVYLHPPQQMGEEIFSGYRAASKEIAALAKDYISPEGFLVLEARDFRTERTLVPTALLLWEDMKRQKGFLLKEIIIIAPEGPTHHGSDEHLAITHRYLLVYRRG